MNKNVITMSVMMAMQATKRKQQDRCFNIEKNKESQLKMKKTTKSLWKWRATTKHEPYKLLLNPQPKLAKIDVQPRSI